jgi:threonylcarbamoyladenosine tRNA methylthiotransferase MtaB
MNLHPNLSGKTFSVITLGCRVNHYEAEALASSLVEMGAEFQRDGESPDIIVALTCSITSVADAKTRKVLRKARRANPASLIAACGCWAQAASAADASKLGVDILVGNRVKERAPLAIAARLAAPARAAELTEIKTDVSDNPDWDNLTLDRPRMLTRAFIKAQDGCDRRCSYCAVPFLRGRGVSRDPDDLVAEISSAVRNGTKEVILTGIQLGGYDGGGVSLAGLIRRVSKIEGLKRLRLGSLEPFSVTDELLEAAAESEIFCRHLHLPLQSGDDEILRSMRRGYDAAGFARIVDYARKFLGGGAHISTDLIVGFPGETGAAFERSLALLENLSLGKVHVFPFSARGGTDAASFGGAVPGGAVRERVGRALALSDDLLSAYAASRAGIEDSILVENEDGGIVSGWSRNYVRVYAPGGGGLKGNELGVVPKISVGSILLCDGVKREDVVLYPDE